MPVWSMPKGVAEPLLGGNRGHEHRGRRDRAGQRALQPAQHEKLPGSVDSAHQRDDHSAADHGAQEHRALAVGIGELSPERGEDEHADRRRSGAGAHPDVEAGRILYPEVLNEERNDRYRGVETDEGEDLRGENGVEASFPVLHQSSVEELSVCSPRGSLKRRDLEEVRAETFPHPPRVNVALALNSRAARPPR